MSRFSKQQYFCNICGKEMFVNCCEMLGGGRTVNWRVCSIKCIREAQWRETLSIMGKEYYPDPRQYDENGCIINDETKNKDNS